MRIKYLPEVVNGKQLQGDHINKYGVSFEKGQTVDVTNPVILAKMLKAPYFIEDGKDFIPSEKSEPKKRGRPARTFDA